MKLSKIHKMLEFKQSDWLNFFFHFNSNKRTKASNNFERNFFKTDD